MNADGTEPTRLTSDGGVDPAGSASGTRIIGLGYGVTTMNADGMAQTRRTNDEYRWLDHDRDWQPVP